MKFSEILKENRDNFEVILGYNDDKNLKINIKENPSILITGSTGTSKSIMMHEILLELINKNSFEDLKIIPISKTRVELNCYADSKYNYCKVISNKDVAIKIIDDLVEKRENLLIKNYVKNFDSYNNINEVEKLPFIVIAIDEATDIISNDDGVEFLANLVRKCTNLGIAVIINTNNVYNNFFDSDDNEYVHVRVSFDFTTRDALMNNIEDSQNLELRSFLVEIGSERTPNKYNIFDFDDKIINEILKNKLIEL